MSWKIWGHQQYNQLCFCENLTKLIWAGSDEGEAGCSHCWYIPTCVRVFKKMEKITQIAVRLILKLRPFSEKSFFLFRRSFVRFGAESIRSPVKWKVWEQDWWGEAKQFLHMCDVKKIKNFLQKKLTSFNSLTALTAGLHKKQSSPSKAMLFINTNGTRSIT